MGVGTQDCRCQESVERGKGGRGRSVLHRELCCMEHSKWNPEEKIEEGCVCLISMEREKNLCERKACRQRRVKVATTWQRDRDRLRL